MKVKKIRESNETNSAIDIMSQDLENQNEGKVGPFWYDPINKELYGERPVIAKSLSWRKSDQFGSEIRTGMDLHQTIWNRQYQKLIHGSSSADKRFGIKDYTKAPRGRVFEFKDSGYKIYVGDWIDNYPEAIEIIKDEFDLPANTEVIKDEHWNIGHGWSQEF